MILGQNTTFQKQKDDKHILMAKINNFATSLMVAVYRANDHYSPTNPPVKADNVYNFADQWNQAKVRGMDCTRGNDARSKY